MAAELMEMIDKNQIASLHRYLNKLNAVDIAKVLMDLEDKDLIVVFRLLSKNTAAEVFSYLDKESQQRLIESFSDDEVKEIIEKLYLDDTVDFIEELPANVVNKVLRNTSFEKRQMINEFLEYDEDSAGSIMTIEFVDLKENMTVREAISYTRKIGINKETINKCFVTDNKRNLIGAVTLKDLILSEEDEIITDIMKKNIIFVKTSEDQERVASLFKEYDLLSMPVVDNDNKLVGIITVDDIVDIIEQENTEDFQKMAAMEPNEEPYLKTSVFELAKHRIIWLLVLMVSATITGYIIEDCEDVLQSVVILASFIPMLMDTGGNAGSQSATLIIRGLALGEIKTRDYLKVMYKEFRVSIIVATVLASVNFLRIYFFTKADALVAITVCVSLFCTVIVAKVVGSILPIVSKKLKLDPAIMASPLITTVVDAFALIIYFEVAKVLLKI